MSDRRITRRKFVRGALGAAAAFTIVPRHVLGGPGYTAPSDVITRAVVGTGGMGMWHVVANEVGKPPVTLAVCDVDATHLAAALEKAGSPCQGYSDFRRVLDRDDIDTVHVATPPHWHALVGIAAAQAGKDVLGEKPVTRTIHEGRVLVETLRRYGRVFQVNTHSRFGSCYRFGATKALRKLVASGLLGCPLTVRLSRNLGFDWKLRMWSGRTDLVPERVPSQLDYDFWLGPAPVKPYHPHRVHGSFRGYWDYDGGGLGDMGQHYLDPVQYILGKDRTGPTAIEARAPWPVHPDAVGVWDRIDLRYEDGDTIVLESGEGKEAETPGLPFLEGPRGKVFEGYRTDPPGLFEQLRFVPDPEPLLDFDTAVRTRRPAGGNEETAHRSCTLVNLAKIAVQVGRPIRWNPVREVVVGDEQANRLVHPFMRAPWHL